MVATLAAGIFTSCAYDANQETIKREEGFNCCVTYDANGGSYGSKSYRTYALVQENSLAPAPGYVDAKTQASIKIPTRRDFQFLCSQVKPTACRTLRRLVEEGKLKNISTPHNPVYVPDNGHYIVVAEK